jgi:c-di-GMP-binding flagellar brake protein YcgR
MFVKGNLREHTRTYFVKQIRFFVNSHERSENDFEQETAVSVDISKGGLGIFTTCPLKEGQLLTFEDEIHTRKAKAKSAVVRWSGKINGSRYRVGLQFVDSKSGPTS